VQIMHEAGGACGSASDTLAMVDIQSNSPSGPW